MSDSGTANKIKMGIVGAGIMGRGIAQIAAGAGIQVILSDLDRVICDDARHFIRKMLDRSVEKGKATREQAEASINNITVTTSLKDLSDCNVIVEAIIENLDVKQSLFRELEKIVTGDCILASNTSSLSITSIAATCKNPDRIAGFHFFNPVPLMKLVEVVKGVRTSDAVAGTLSGLATRFGHHPILVADSPGFLVNHAGRGLVTEGLRLLYENVTDPRTIDAIIRDSAGFRMGPFELMDLTGLDVTFPATEAIYQQYFHEPRLRPTPLQQRRFSAGLYGRKTGEGFYRYEDNSKILDDEPVPAPADGKSAYWVTHNCYPELREKVICLIEAGGGTLDTSDKAGVGSIAVVLPLGLDISTTAHLEGLDATRTIGVDALFNLEKRIVLMSNPATSSDVINETSSMFAGTGKSISVIRDSAGFVAQRIIATIINIACDIAQQGIAAPGDIDKGAVLGLGYPEGPLETGNRLGSDKILTILEGMQACYGDPRYRPSPWLRRRALHGLSLLHVE